MKEANDISFMAKRTEEAEEEDSAVAVLSERSPVRLGLIIAVLSVGFTIAAAAWYLATSLAKIETKLDAISMQVSSATSTVSSLDRRVSEHERDDNNNWKSIESRVSIIERIGSPKMHELEKRVTELETEFKIVNNRKP